MDIGNERDLGMVRLIFCLVMVMGVSKGVAYTNITQLVGVALTDSVLSQMPTSDYSSPHATLMSFHKAMHSGDFTNIFNCCSAQCNYNDMGISNLNEVSASIISEFPTTCSNSIDSVINSIVEKVVTTNSLLSLSALLTRENIYLGAQQEVYSAITDMMRESVVALRASGRFAEQERIIREVALKSCVFDAFGANLETPVQREFAFVSEGDIDRQLREAERKLGAAGLCTRYGRRFAEDGETFKIECIVLAKDEAFQRRLHAYAKGKFRELDDANRRYLVMRSESVQSEYDAIVASSDVVTRHNFILPQDVPPYNRRDGKVYTDHLYADDEGKAQIGFDSQWEPLLVQAEESRGDFACWLRNPARANWALSLAYAQANEQHAFYPDLLVFRRDYHKANEHGYLVDILEPHADCFADNLPKAQSLARYAQETPRLGRVQLIRQEPDLGGGRIFRRFDFCRGEVRDAVGTARNDDDLNAIFARYGMS